MSKIWVFPEFVGFMPLLFGSSDSPYVGCYEGSTLGVLMCRLWPVGERPFQMGTDDGIHAVLMQTCPQIDIGSLKLSKQHSPPQFEMIKCAGIHGLASTNG
jgi:hypothetical protein